MNFSCESLFALYKWISKNYPKIPTKLKMNNHTLNQLEKSLDLSEDKKYEDVMFLGIPIEIDNTIEGFKFEVKE